MKKLVCAALLAASIVVQGAPVPSIAAAQASAEVAQPFDLSSVKLGIVAVDGQSRAVRKVLVQRGSETQYFTLPSGSGGNIPLTKGSGDYQITLYEQVKGTSYRKLASTTVAVKLENENAVYLQSVQPIAWNGVMAAIRKAKELTAGAKTDTDKMNAIYRYITSRFAYDYKKADGPLAASYTPDVEATFETDKGICYDAAALYAAMLRGVGIPAKLVKGYAPNIKAYHAWNQVYLKGKGWLTMDVTTDAGYVQAGRKVDKVKNASLYRVDAVM